VARVPPKLGAIDGCGAGTAFSRALGGVFENPVVGVESIVDRGGEQVSRGPMRIDLDNGVVQECTWYNWWFDGIPRVQEGYVGDWRLCDSPLGLL